MGRLINEMAQREGWPSEIGRRISGLVGSESGFAVPTVLLALVAAFGLATATVIASVSAQKGTTRDQDSKAALSVAEAGAENAMLRYNRIEQDPVATADDCLPLGGSLASAPGGWCPNQITGTVDRGSFVYQVRPTLGVIEVVSTGTVSGVTRRVHVFARSSGGIRPFGDASVIGLDSITLDSNAHINANVATNGNITLNSNSGIECDYAEVGVGFGVIVRSNAVFNCPGPFEGSTSLPPVNIGDVATNNANDRICVLDPVLKRSCNQVWNPTTKVLNMSSNSSITLGASGGTYNYFFCRLELDSNSSLYIAGGARVRIYLGSPDFAPCLNQTLPLVLDSNSQIAPTGAGALDVALLVVGSDTRPTSVLFNSNTELISCAQTFVIYAPRSAIEMNSNSEFCGGMAGQSVHLDSNAVINVAGQADDFELPNTVAAHYVRDEFVECSAIAATAPSYEAGC